ncbi:unnamed protein product, partial [Protopolystoma xenopodis]
MLTTNVKCLGYDCLPEPGNLVSAPFDPKVEKFDYAQATPNQPGSEFQLETAILTLTKVGKTNQV